MLYVLFIANTLSHKLFNGDANMFNQKPLRQDWFLFVFMLILVPIAGEPKIHPFTGDFENFRVSFGSPVFLLFLLWLQSFSRIFLGISAGIAVMIFRACLDIALYGQPMGHAFLIHVPNFFYYFIYALFFALPQLTRKSIYAQTLGGCCTYQQRVAAPFSLQKNVAKDLKILGNRRKI